MEQRSLANDLPNSFCSRIGIITAPIYGFTLIELLVTVAILTVLMSLLLPTIQASRESTRRINCQSNMRQVGLSILNYEQMHSELPIGCIGNNPPKDPSEKQRFISWIVQILPLIEEGELSHQYQIDVPSYESPNKDLGKNIIPLVLCPSTPSELVLSTTGLWRGQAFTDYAGVYGVEGEGRDRPADSEPSQQSLNDDSLGVLVFETPVLLKHITDGTTYTGMVAEALFRRVPAMEWACGRNILAQQQTNPINGFGLGSEIGSPHPGGAQVTFCDGHVDFLRDDTEQDVLNALLTRSGGEVR